VDYFALRRESKSLELFCTVTIYGDRTEFKEGNGLNERTKKGEKARRRKGEKGGSTLCGFRF
jgi:hypothetical protein